ncbi:ATP-dependent DNA helicase [Hellea balneolensis]|uniref:ATP-dependent DNA helicase n=1 Tax=Hellea balneolensis TaxID=287478 RepID=UPI00041A3AF8|nr:AAA family ATPase [Hellea balneolensis]
MSDLSSFPESYEDDPTIAHILQQLRSNDPSPILITGEAGTGKSTLVNYIKTHGDFANTAVLAPTGVAALNIGGQTLHSFFRFPFQPIDENALADQRRNRLWKKVKLIIIDEISMVRADMLDGMDIILRKAQDSRLPFGGCRVLLVGDFYQLPPVIPAQEKAILVQMGYEGPYAYNANVLENYPPVHFELSKVYRQRDARFVEILSNLRLAQNVEKAVETLNGICVKPHREGHTPVLLTSTNAIANRYNKEGLANLTSTPLDYDSVTKGRFNEKRAPVPPKLTLKKGARIMAVRNDPLKRWVNGSLGTITDLTKNEVYVRFDSGPAIRKIEAATWESINYKWNEVEQKMEEEASATFEQMPLILAWAVTIHKAQGLTLSDVRVDMGRGAFAPGQAYVALSRAQTLDGLSLTTPLRPSDIKFA